MTLLSTPPRYYAPLNNAECALIRQGAKSPKAAEYIVNRIAFDRPGMLREEVVDFIHSHKIEDEQGRVSYPFADWKPAESVTDDPQLTFPFHTDPTITKRVYHACPHCRSYLACGPYWKDAITEHLVREHTALFWHTHVDEIRAIILPQPLPTMPGVVVVERLTEIEPATLELFPPRIVPLKMPLVVSDREMGKPDFLDRYAGRMEIETV